MAKVSVSIPDELMRDLRALAPGNVSAFVAAAVRNELDRRRLFAFLDELEGELGPVDEEEVTEFTEAFSAIAAGRPGAASGPLSEGRRAS